MVISIIALLIALLLPALGSARESAREATCRGEFRQLSLGINSYATEHDGRIPAAYVSSWQGDKPWQKVWMGNEAWVDASGTPRVNHQGTLVDYIGGTASAQDLYRCPSLEKGTWGSGRGSNGRFDRSMLLVFSGATIERVPMEVDMPDPDAPGKYQRVLTPIIVEETDAFINGPYIDPGHSNIDYMGTWHKQGATNYASLDGSVQYLTFGTTRPPVIRNWIGKSPGGKKLILDSSSALPKGFGGWDTK